MLKLYEDEATGEVGDTDVCEQVAAALSTARARPAADQRLR
jgi:hypothetical protein